MSKLKQIFQAHSGPPVNIEGIIRDLGIDLDKKAELDAEISGQIELLSNGVHRISVNRGEHYYRQRFTMAHELGHYLYHSHLMRDGIDDNRAYRSEPHGRFHNTNITRSEETEANQFAAAILMPADILRREWQNNRDVEALAKKFQVSKRAMEIRLEGLGCNEQI